MTRDALLLVTINPFHTNLLFLYPLKISENLLFSDVFRVIEVKHWPEIGQSYSSNCNENLLPYSKRKKVESFTDQKFRA